MASTAVAIAGALGALTRYWVSLAFGGAAFPWATLGINTTGSFLLGLVLGWAPGRWNATLVTAVGVGFLGAFTTFSTFSNETLSLLREGRQLAAASYVLASVLLGLLAALAGYSLQAAGDRPTPG